MGIETIYRPPLEPYFVEISRGLLSGKTNFRGLGYNFNVGSAIEDVTEYGGSIVQIGSAGVAMQIDGAHADDTGVANFSGTATGGSVTTLVDTAKDFTAGGTPVVVGDIVINDTLLQLAVVTGVTATTLTFADGYGDGSAGSSGDSYRILDVSAGGTGAQLVEVNGLDVDWAEQSEFVLPNGTGTRNLVNTYRRVNSFHVMCNGTDGGATTGTILLEDQATGAITYAQITAGGNMMLQAYYTIPAGKTGYITDWVASATGSQAARVLLRARAGFNDRVLLPNTFLFQDVITVQDASVHHVLPIPIRVPAKSDIKVSAFGTASGAAVATSFGFWLE